MTEVTDIDGVGPAMGDRLAENGYDSVDEIARADKDELSSINRVTEDKALDFIVQAQNLLGDEAEETEEEGDEFDLTPGELSDVEQESDEEEVEEEPEPEPEEEEPEPEPEPEDEGPSVYSIELTFDTMEQYDVYHAALMRRHEAVYTGNQPAADALKKCLDGLDNFEKVEYELTESELNELHSAILQQRTDYQGENLIDHMDALKVVERQLNDQRSEYLF